MKPTLAVLYGDAGSAALIDALKHWREDHAPGAAYETLLAEYITSVEIHTGIRAGGQATMLINVRARRKRDSDQYYYEAEIAAGELKLTSITD